MAITVVNEPSQHFSIWKDYYFKYSSSISATINFKYNIQYQELVTISGTPTWVTQDTFSRFPDPDGSTTFNLRQYLSTQTVQDYFPANYSLADGLYTNPLNNKFRLIVQESYAYQFPWGIFNSSGVQLDPGVSASSTKYYGLYDLKLTFTYPGASQTPIFIKGSVIELIDNSNPTTNPDSINGIYTVLEVGINYIVVNGIYDAGKTYYSGSSLWSDHRIVINSSTAYTSGSFISINSCSNDDRYFYTSIGGSYTLREGSVILIPIENMYGIQIWDEDISDYILDDRLSVTGDALFKWTVPNNLHSYQIYVIDSDENVVDTIDIKVIEKCESKYKKTTLNFLDRNGAFIPFYFDLLNTKQLSIVNSNWKGQNTYGRTTKYQIDTQLNEQYQLTTDWISDKESDLFQELFASSYIWMYLENSSVPQKVLVVDKQLQVKKIQNQKLINYQLIVELANEKFINI